jgi:transposase InsO family protein
MDFVMDALSSARRLKCLTVVDDFTKEAIELVLDHSITGDYVTRALDQWVVYRNGVDLKLIQAGKPTQNAYIESFNDKLRDEWLNEHWFARSPKLGARRACACLLQYASAVPISLRAFFLQRFARRKEIPDRALALSSHLRAE